MSVLFPLMKGFSASGSLIIAIGAQNAFVLRQGLARHHLFLTACFCSLVDSLLIVMGVVGFGHFISSTPVLIEVAKYFAIIFLFFYGASYIRSACKSRNLDSSSCEEIYPTVKRTVIVLLALTVFNPHVYLDTVILLGSIASQHPEDEKIFFALGAVVASFSWFFSLTYGARLLDPLLKKKNAWRILDGLTGITLLGIAYALLTL